MAKGSAKLELAKRHLERVQAAWDDPTDWENLYLYGFYCLEAAVEAAALHFAVKTSPNHSHRVEVASTLHRAHGLPDVSGLLRDLNQARKAVAYGDVDAGEHDPEELALEIENFVEAVEKMYAKGTTSD